VDYRWQVYVADTYNDTIRRITPIGTNWLVTTIAGQVGNRNAGFGFACGMSADSAGNIYVVDNYHNALIKSRRQAPTGSSTLSEALVCLMA
jgi:ribosomal protein S11